MREDVPLKIQRSELKKARIEIIPMIDTIFFLLVYFMMLSLTMVQMSAFKVALPQSTTAEGKPLEKVVVSLSQTGDYYFNREKIDKNSIAAALTTAVSQNPYITVIINVDKNQTVAQFTDVLNTCEAANPGNLVIATEHAAGK